MPQSSPHSISALLPGGSLERRTSSIPSGEKAAARMNSQEAPTIGPSNSYPSPTAAHAPQSAFYDPHPRSYPDDEDMQMANSLSQDMQGNIGTQLTSAPEMSNGHGREPEQDLAISPSIATAPGMAPPQTPHQQSLSGPSGQPPSGETGQESGFPGDSGRRKRSKVSRACDECRRKKVCV